MAFAVAGLMLILSLTATTPAFAGAHTWSGAHNGYWSNPIELVVRRHAGSG